MNGKWCGRKRVTTPSISKKRRHEGVQRPLQVAHVDVPVDHQALHLVEHRRVGGVAVAAIDPARPDDADRRRLVHGELRRRRRGVGAPHHPHLDRAGVGAQQLALAVRVRASGRRCRASPAPDGGAGSSAPRSCGSRPRCPGPRRRAKPISAKIATISSITCRVGCTEPLRRGGAGRERSSRPAASCASSAAASSSALRAAISAATRSRRPLIAGPAARARPGSSGPATSAGRRLRPVLPSAATRIGSSASRSGAAAIWAARSAFQCRVVGHGSIS